MSVASDFVTAKAAFNTTHAAELATIEALRPPPFIDGSFQAGCDDSGNLFTNYAPLLALALLKSYPSSDTVWSCEFAVTATSCIATAICFQY
jgi:hypothetical protein